MFAQVKWIADTIVSMNKLQTVVNIDKTSHSEFGFILSVIGNVAATELDRVFPLYDYLIGIHLDIVDA